MTTIALLEAFSYCDGHDFTGDDNEARLSLEAVALDRSTFRSQRWQELTGGLKSATFEESGFWASGDTDAVDPEAFAALTGGRTLVHTFGPDEHEGGVAYLWRGGKFAYQLLGTLGEMAPFTLRGQGTDRDGVVRGRLAAAMGEVAAAGPLGSAVQLGPGTAGTHVYATLHAFAVTGSVTVAVQSSPDATFTTPTTLATFPAVTARGGHWLPRIAADTLTDVWLRLTVTDVTGTATLAGALALA